MSKFYYGGQAVLEGVMMRGRRHMAVAVRNPKGEIVVHSEPLNSKVYTSRYSKMPFIRGLVMLADTLVLGTRALMFSANVSLEDQGEKIEKGAIGWMLAVSLTLAIGLFFVTPLLLVGTVESIVHDSLLTNLLEGVVRLALFVGYLALIGRAHDIKRVFAYHGAEHKAIDALEAGAALEPAEVEKFSTSHPRCGTSFLLVVVVLSVLLFAMFGKPELPVRILSRVVLVPVLAMVGYEFIRFAAGHMTNPVIRLLLAPGLALQKLTTRMPDRAMLEVSLAALKRVMAEDASEVAVPEAAVETPSLHPAPAPVVADR